MIGSFKLRSRILFGYSIPIMLMMGLGWIAYSSAAEVYTAFRQGELSKNALLETDEMVLASSKMVRAMRGYLINQDGDFLNDYENSIKVFRERGQSVARVIQDDQQKERLQKIIQLEQELEEFYKNLMTLIQEKKLSQAIQLFSQGQGRRIIQEIEALSQEFRKKESEILGVATKRAEEAINFLILAALIGTLLAIAIAIGTGYLISSGISQTINRAVNSISSSSTEIAATTEQQERMAVQQASSVNQTTTTMDELGVSSQQAAEQAESAATGARQALSLTEGGNHAVGRTLKGMETLRQKVEAISESIMKLSEQADQIGSISSLVADLANQTNMLALNAAVEAVRAGEQGKGFAVVAAEIRKLADQSQKSTHKINTLVADIQGAVNSTVMVTDEGTQTVEEGVKIAQETAATFKGIAESIDQIFLSSQQISLTVKQQAAAIQQVVDAMNALNAGAQQTATGITQTKVGTQQLNDAALNLKAIV